MEFRRFGLDCYFWSSICPQNGLFLNFEGDLETTLTRFSPFLTFPTLSVDKSIQFVNPLLGYYPLLVTKGQLISKCLFGVIVWTKIATKILKFFVASWGLPGDLVSNSINKEAYRKPQKAHKKPQESYKNFRAEILTIFSLLFWSKQ